MIRLSSISVSYFSLRQQYSAVLFLIHHLEDIEFNLPKQQYTTGKLNNSDFTAFPGLKGRRSPRHNLS